MLGLQGVVGLERERGPRRQTRGPHLVNGSGLDNLPKPIRTFNRYEKEEANVINTTSICGKGYKQGFIEIRPSLTPQGD